MYNAVDYHPVNYSNASTYQYSHTFIQAPFPVAHGQWRPSEYDQDDHKYDASTVYRPSTNNTPPPEESLHTLLREKNDKYIPFTNLNLNTPLSPMSMRSVDTFDTAPLSPSFNNSPILHSTLYYINNEDTYYQDFAQDHHQQQLQLQMQYELEHLQEPPTYLTGTVFGTQYPQSYMNNTRYDYTHTTQHNTIMNTTTKATQDQPKRKRNSSKRTPSIQLICPTCSRKFSRPYNLKSHQRTHTNERPYVCHSPGCGWTFARPHDLKRHDLLHSGIKKYICSCGKPFARSDAFKRHQALDKICSARKIEGHM